MEWEKTCQGSEWNYGVGKGNFTFMKKGKTQQNVTWKGNGTVVQMESERGGNRSLQDDIIEGSEEKKAS